jgi:hypothetical protein
MMVVAEPEGFEHALFLSISKSLLTAARLPTNARSISGMRAQHRRLITKPLPVKLKIAGNTLDTDSVG